MANREVQMSLNEGVLDVLAQLTGVNLEYEASTDRFQVVARQINRALRAVALERDWSCYTSTEDVGLVVAGATTVEISSSLRPRIVGDDAIRLVNDDGAIIEWCYFLPRNALHKYQNRAGIWASSVRSTILFSRPFMNAEAGLHIMVPAMREPKMFDLPAPGEDIDDRILNTPIDFDYPDLVLAKAAQYVAEFDPVMQPRAQTLEAHYKDLMYQLIERDTNTTDTPYQNEFMVPILGELGGRTAPLLHGHPHADERR